MEKMTPDHVQQVLNELNTGIKITFYDSSTATSQQAADIIVDGKPILVLGSGDQFIDDRKLAAMFDVGRKKVKIAKPEQCIEIYGYAPGGVPPIAHRSDNLPVYIDNSLQRYERVYAAGGAHNAIFPIMLEQLQTITSGQFVDVKKD